MPAHDLRWRAVVDRQLGQPPPAVDVGVEHLAHERAPAAEPVCAMSPTRVIDFVGHRRISIRHAIADSSCASSTTTCPYAQVRSTAGSLGRAQDRPFVGEPARQRFGTHQPTRTAGNL